MSELQQIKAFFDSYHLALSDEWLQCCINWCKTDCLPPNYTQQELQVKVYEQWLLLDLRQMQVACLPRGISNQKKYTLTGTYCLQMMQVVDISKPKLWQIQRIRNTVGKNTEPENDFGKRVLQLTLTDGVQEIEAFEFKPISCININLVPGIKMKIMGPINVRNGRLMLESHHIKILGGEVEEIRITNAAENILARSLALKENPNPFVIDESILTANMDIMNRTNQETQNTFSSFQNNKTQNSKQQQTLTNNFNETNNAKNNALTNKSNSNTIKKTSEENFEIDEELLREFQNNEFEEEGFENTTKNSNRQSSNLATTKSARSCSSSGTHREHTAVNTRNTKSEITKSSRNNPSPDMFDNLEFDDELLNEHLDQLDKSLENEKNDLPNADKRCKVVASSGEKNDDDFFNNSDLDAHLDRLDAEMKEVPSSTQIFTSDKSIENTSRKSNAIQMAPAAAGFPKSNVFSIAKLKKLQPNVGKGKFRIKADFKEVVEKMAVVEETKQYKLVICVQDDDDELLLSVHSDLVADWMELSVESIMEVKESICQKNTEAIEKFKTALTKLRENVMNLSGVLEVEITRGEKYAVLVSVQP